MMQEINYVLSNGQTITVYYDEYGRALISREAIEWLISHLNENIKREGND